MLPSQRQVRFSSFKPSRTQRLTNWNRIRKIANNNDNNVGLVYPDNDDEIKENINWFIENLQNDDGTTTIEL